ncbi:MAG: hypothetical protein Q9195_004806 [Heterodermia aff. obscurata]
MSGKRRAAGSSSDKSNKPIPPHGSPLPSSPVQRRQPGQGSDLYPQSRDSAFAVPPRPQQHRLQQQQRSGKVAIPRLPRDADSALVNPDGKRDRTKRELITMIEKIENYERLLRDLSLRTSDEDQSLIRRALQKVSFSPFQSLTYNTADICKESVPDPGDVLSETSSQKSQSNVAVEGVEELGGEHRAPARVGSTGSLDNIDEDYNRSPAARATGYLGKNSEVVWMQRLHRWADEPGIGGDSPQKSDEAAEHRKARPTMEYGAGLGGIEQHPTSGSTYHCDDLPVNVSEQVDPFELPPKQVADQFFQIYLDTVHPAFPILGKSTFISQYQTFANRKAFNTGNNWRAILNMIFAISARHSHLTQAEWRGDERDHLIYFARSRMLSFNGDSIFAHPELQHIQVTGLMAFYLTAISQVNRAWALSGIAIRQAITLGLNLQNDSKDVLKASREIRYRLWWVLCSMERTLAVMTGRVVSFSATDCSVPLPLPVGEETLFDADPRPASRAKMPISRHLSSHSSREQPSSPPAASDPDRPPDGSDYVEQLDPELSATDSSSDGLCFLFNVKLSILTDETMNRLYRAGVSRETWAQVQGKINDLNAKLSEWLQDLPTVFDFTRKHPDQQFLRHRLHLGFAYYSTSTIINRPALCRIDDKVARESERAKKLNRKIAAKCVHSAKAMLEMLPNVPDAVGLYSVAPWWCLVHHLVQAATVLMLELSFRAHHMPDEAEGILQAAKKAVVWLRAMSEEDMAALRAWMLCDGLLRKVALKVGWTVDDLPAAHDAAGGSHGQPAMNIGSGSNPAYQRLTPQAGHGPFYTGSQLEGHLFQPQIYTSYDESFPDPMGAPPTSSSQFGAIFPSTAQMDILESRDFANMPAGSPGGQAGWDQDGTHFGDAFRFF